MKYIFLYLFLFFNLFAYSQTNYKVLVDSLRFVTEMPYISSDIENDEGAKQFWNVVKAKKAIIPFLIDKLSDTTLTAANVNNFGGKYTVADISYQAINEIIKGVPTFELLGIMYEKNGCGYCVYWKYLRKDYNNRLKFKNAVQKWYDKNKNKLIWVKSSIFLTCDCRGIHPSGGHYELK